MVLATKGGIRPPVPYDSSPAGITAACEDSLRRLGVETIDLYQIHRPDMYTHPADLAAALIALRDAGKIRAVGVSNHTPAQTEALAAHLPFPVVTDQPEFSVMHLDPMRDGTFDACMRTGRVPIVWSPLAGGRVISSDGMPDALARPSTRSPSERCRPGDRRSRVRARPPERSRRHHRHTAARANRRSRGRVRRHSRPRRRLHPRSSLQESPPAMTYDRTPPVRDLSWFGAATTTTTVPRSARITRSPREIGLPCLVHRHCRRP